MSRKINNSPSVMHRYLPLGLVVGLILAFRVLGSTVLDAPPNFQPLGALFFCGSLLAPGWRGFAIPACIWGLTYPLGIGPISDFSILFTTLLALTATFFLGKSMAQRGLPILLLGSVAAAGIFHWITNTAAWLGDPIYQKSLTGLWQSVWSGPTGSPVPSWVFLRNSIAANLLFTSLFALAQLKLPRFAVRVATPQVVK